MLKLMRMVLCMLLSGFSGQLAGAALTLCPTSSLAAPARPKAKKLKRPTLVGGIKKEEAAAQRHRLTRFADQAALQRAVNQKLLVRVPDTGIGFAIDAEVGKHADKNQELYRYARVYTHNFIHVLGERYNKVSNGGSFVISSLVRTCKYQQRIAKRERNHNAVTCDKTTHTTGATIDIMRSLIPPEYRSWFRAELARVSQTGTVLVKQENHQPVYHVMVLPTYRVKQPIR